MGQTTSSPPETRRLLVCSYAQLEKVQLLELLKLRQMMRPSLVMAMNWELALGVRLEVLSEEEGLG